MRRRLIGGIMVLVVILGGRSLPVAPLVPTPTPIPPGATPQSLRIAYPDSLAPAITALASTYQRHDPMTQITLVERADTLSIEALTNRDVDFAILTGSSTGTLAEDVWRVTLARDGLAVIVNPQNGIPGVTMDQLRRLFQGQIEDWVQWEGIPGTPQLVSREEASGDYVFFQRTVMKDARVSLTAYLAPSTEAVLQLVGDEPLSVGYVSMARIDGRVRTLAIDGVPPAEETIMAGLYSLSREIYLVALTEPEGAARSFAQWALDNDGQAALERQGLFRGE